MGAPASLATVATTGVNFDVFLSKNTAPLTGYVQPTTAYPAKNLNPDREPVTADISNTTGNGYYQSATGQKKMTFSCDFVNLVNAPTLVEEGAYYNFRGPVSGYGDMWGVFRCSKVSEKMDVSGDFTINASFECFGTYYFNGSSALS